MVEKNGKKKMKIVWIFQKNNNALIIKKKKCKHFKTLIMRYVKKPDFCFLLTHQHLGQK